MTVREIAEDSDAWHSPRGLAAPLVSGVSSVEALAARQREIVDWPDADVCFKYRGLIKPHVFAVSRIRKRERERERERETQRDRFSSRARSPPRAGNADSNRQRRFP